MTLVEVPDEWAAVMLHQAEAEQMIQSEEKRLYRERQKLYREALDKQHIETVTRYSSNNAQKKQEGGSLGIDSEKREKELKSRKKATSYEQLMEMKEHEQLSQAEKTREQIEKSDYQQYLNKLEEYDDKMQMMQKERKLQLANDLRRSYNEQEMQKKQKPYYEKTYDIKLLEQQKEQWPIVDFEKKRVSHCI